MLLRYLAHIKHPVRDAGRPIYKSPDLQKVQLIVDQIKNVDFLNLDEENTATTECPETVDESMPIIELLDDEGKRSSRNVFHDFVAKIKKTVGGSKKTRRGSRSLKLKQKRKSNGLFSNLDIIPSTQYKEVAQHENEASEQESKVAQLAADAKLLKDMNKFQSKLSAEQQIDISDFLDHIEDKPKPFKFDTTPFMLTQLEKNNHPSLDKQQEDQQEDDTLLGARKFFDFDSAPVKRSLNDYQAEDYQKIAKLKSKLIDEYRHHHPIIDYADIFRRLEASHNTKVEKTDDFLDRNYQLNDGSSKLRDVLKPYHSDKHVMSPYELNLNLQLDKQFKELDSFDLREKKTNPLDDDIPLYKPEIDRDREIEELVP